MGLSADEQAQLDALQAKASEPDDDEFEVEIYDENGRGARLPYRKGRSWLQQHFGIDLEPAPEGEGEPEGEGKPPKTGKGKTGSGGKADGPAQRYFGSKRAS